MPKSLSAGDHIASRCNKCKDTTNHTIVAMVGSVVARVECNICGSVHNHRGEKPAKLPASRPAAAAKPRTSSRSQQQRDWEELAKATRPEDTVPYSLKTPMKPGMLIVHPTFGFGQVLETIRPNKMEVRFADGVKLLRCSLP